MLESFLVKILSRSELYQQTLDGMDEKFTTMKEYY